MPKFKKGGGPAPAGAAVHQHPKKHRKMHMFSKLSTTSSAAAAKAPQGQGVGIAHPEKKNGSDGKKPSQKQQKQQKNQRPVVPFGRKDRILLVGEGDFSFARSLVLQHHCKNVIATCYDSKETLYDKYPKAEHIIHDILDASTKRPTNADVPDSKGTSSPSAEKGTNNKDEVGNHNAQGSIEDQTQRRGPKVLYAVDARKLGLPGGGGKEIRSGFSRRERQRPAWKKAKDGASSSASKGGPWDVICFNFPHVGGLSTDVNRQVRANQELLVAFFKACVPLLSHRPEPAGSDDEEDWDDWENSEPVPSQDEDDGDGDGDGDGDSNQLRSANTTGQATCQPRVEPGQILVSMFEGEPYTLWNIKDLARHAGLRVVTSFRFPWACYREYSHARTLGDVEGRHGGRGGWRGEDRDARMYVFEVKQEDHSVGRRNFPSSKPETSVKKKRSRDASESEDSE
ncbi:25S rRNA (uracil2634-N3)-methyltransferase [Aspergillus ibericus CBS 121593]|uniref:25S rRNA (uridine-N(3))-methyltransferase BMT5-like domain-containing protein n=1 Tax=Aspergillus ibericus CBS 121593 TaxID=1448316 RepID=A0A395HCJ3_9EURO|nr:hypothetical protein BO80DRAFT_420849 [Aspergillus ibericus CBS 121593]RAL05647.1 hypothetical protein BO80DRAFT_420849 [Aspergillus ibericus CBS 121593]